MSEREELIDYLWKTTNTERERRKLEKRVPRKFFELMTDEDLRGFAKRLEASPREQDESLPREEMIELLLAAANISETLRGRATREFYEDLETETLRHLVTILGNLWPPEGWEPPKE